jgi:hypothetical protein
MDVCGDYRLNKRLCTRLTRRPQELLPTRAKRDGGMRGEHASVCEGVAVLPTSYGGDESKV